MNDNIRLLRRERFLLTLLGLICIGLLAGALYLQYVERQAPCTLCVIQRYFFALIAIFAFIGATLKSWRGIAALEVLIVISAIAGAVPAARHLHVQLVPGFSCGFDPLQSAVNSMPPAHWLPSVFKVGGLCEIVYPPILGIPLPGWSLIGFVLIAVLVAASCWRHRKYCG